MEEANAGEIPQTRRRRHLMIGGEILLILVILALSGAILIPVVKGPSSDTDRRPEFDGVQLPRSISR